VPTLPLYGIVNERSAPVLSCLGLPLIFDEKLYGVDGEHHLHRTARVEFFDGANRPAYALGAHFHPERSGIFFYLDEDPYHPF
jgi:hypothetical protein